ncbi:MAG: cytidine deaminase [Actinomycetaceae bacterium]|nr:cytidine deaminase [Actinomycetaceae bacterium]
MTNEVTEEVWQVLHETAVDAMKRAYAPYSKYPVGAAALVDDGRILSGCNVENAALGVTLCAECGVISDLINGGGGRLVAFTCVNEDGAKIVPCGRCRQILFEHSGKELLLYMPDGIQTMDQVLPGAFGPADLHQITERADG